MHLLKLYCTRCYKRPTNPIVILFFYKAVTYMQIITLDPWILMRLYLFLIVRIQNLVKVYLQIKVSHKIKQ
jgi:hypothetical protein